MISFVLKGFPSCPMISLPILMIIYYASNALELKKDNHVHKFTFYLFTEKGVLNGLFKNIGIESSHLITLIITHFKNLFNCVF